MDRPGRSGGALSSMPSRPSVDSSAGSGTEHTISPPGARKAGRLERGAGAGQGVDRSQRRRVAGGGAPREGSGEGEGALPRGSGSSGWSGSAEGAWDMGGVRELGCSEDGSGRGYLAAAGTRGFTLFVSRGMQRGQGWVPELSDSEASADTSLGAVAPALTGLALSGDAEEVSRPGTRQAPMGPSSSEAGTGNAAQAFTRPPLVASVSGRAETGTAAARAPVHRRGWRLICHAGTHGAHASHTRVCVLRACRGISRGRLGATASQQQLMLRGAVFEDLHMSMSEAVRWDDQGAEAYETALPSGHALLTESEDDEKGAWPMRDDDARDAFAAQALRGPSRQPSLRRLASLRANLMALKFVQDR